MAKTKKAVILTTDDSTFIALCRDLYEKNVDPSTHDVYAQSKNLLLLFGSGAVISSSFLTPHAGSAGKEINLVGQPRDQREWKKFNTGYLKQTIDRLLAQGYLEYAKEHGIEVIAISDEGRRKILSFAIEKEGPVRSKKWDGKWRMVLYDIDAKAKTKQQGIRKALKDLGFIQLQRSVYIIPFDCRKQVSFMRVQFALGNAIQYIDGAEFEDDIPYRRHFGL